MQVFTNKILSTSVAKNDLTSANIRLLRIILVAWLITKLLCYKLWLGVRLFPLVPVNNLFTGLPAAVHVILFAASLLSMAFFIFSPGRKVALLLFIAEILSCLCDQNRWQPWEYQFLFMTAAYVFVKDESRLRFNWQLIIAGIYFFSGVSKFSSGFIHDIWQNLILHFFRADYTNTWLLRAGYILPVAEILAGIGLLTIRMRKICVWFLTAIHLIIFIAIGVFGLAKNSVILPWNLAMPLMLFPLFYYSSFRNKEKINWKAFTWVTLVLWWIMPWLQLFGYWDKYLSSVLYSGGVEQLYICTDNPAAKKQLLFAFEKNVNMPCDSSLSLYKWSMQEMNVPPYPETRIYQAVIKEWMKRYPEGNRKFILIKPGFVPRITTLEAEK